MFFSLFIAVYFTPILSLQIGKIPCSSIRSNSTYSPSLKSNCTDCLCNCFSSASCSAINCFPNNRSCQFITNRTWILESDLSFNSTSKKFIAIKANTSRFCSCYTPTNILNQYGRINSSDTAMTTDMHSIKYIANDHTLIVLNSTFVQKLSANNLSDIRRSLSASPGLAVSILHDDTKIYIAFAFNRSINMFDLNLTLLQTSTSWSDQSGYFGGMFFFNNRILILDVSQSIIWSLNTLNQRTLNEFFNFSPYNISNPTTLFIHQNQTLYISSRSQHLYLFNLSDLTLKRTLSLSINISMLFMRYDSNCNRLWLGSQNYTYAPVVDLSSNQINLYTTKGRISRYGIYSIDFNDDYTAFYTDTNGNVWRSDLSNIDC